MPHEPGTVTKVTPGGDATAVEVSSDRGRLLVWTVPNMMYARLGYAVGSKVSLHVDELGNLIGVAPPAGPASKTMG